MKFLFVLLLATVNSYAASLPLAPYIKLQETLAADDFKNSLTAHQALCQGPLKASKTYKDCTKKFKSIDELRTSFKTISEIYLSDVKELKGHTKASCPMANARWIQKEGPLRNPYYGKSMLECGEKI